MGQITWSTDVYHYVGEIVGPDGKTILIDSDWAWPGTATSFGWSLQSVQNCKDRKDFDFGCECGFLVCDDCREPFYPMEVEIGWKCPECDGQCRPRVACDHDSTDGTVDCKDCGLKASDFIAAAYDWLRDNDGATADDPGYFQE